MPNGFPMTLETQLVDSMQEQMEFPFLNKIRMQLYAQKQREEMYSIYNLQYRYDGDHGTEMKFGDFISSIWIKGNFAQRFHDKYYKVYFYDKQ